MIIIKKIDAKIDKISAINKIASRAFKKCVAFFGVVPMDVGICLMYSRQEMNNSVKRETPEWFVGGAGNNSVAIFSPSVFSKVSSHPDSDFIPVLTHEIAHIFTKAITNAKEPLWLIEGISGYIAEQYKIRPLYKKNIQNFAEIHDKTCWQKTTNYAQAYSFTKYLIDKLGKKNFLELVSRLDEKDSFDQFKNKVQANLNSDFQDLEKDWLNQIK